MGKFDEFEPRDPEVERATGGGWGTFRPNRVGLVAAGVVGVIAGFFPDSPIGRALNEPPVKSQKESKVDVIGVEYGTTETLKPAGGLLVIGAYVGFTRLVRPRLEAAARERREAREEPPEE